MSNLLELQNLHVSYHIPRGTVQAVRGVDLTLQPGEVLAASPKEGLVLAAGKDAVRILQLQAPGGKQMPAADYLRGHPAQVGSVWHAPVPAEA